MKTYHSLLCAFFALLASLVRADEKRPTLTAEQKTFLAQYESIRAALAADDLAVTRKAAAALTAPSAPATDAAGKIATAESLAAAREAFKPLSKEAVALAAGQPGYYHAHCPMVPKEEGDWVQISKKINNPYFGKSMLTCGSLEK